MSFLNVRYHAGLYILRCDGDELHRYDSNVNVNQLVDQDSTHYHTSLRDHVRRQDTVY